jgi:hypothetical protein
MKKALFFTVITAFIIIGCQSEPKKNNPAENQGTISVFQPSPEDIVNMHGDIENLERFFAFLENVNAGKKDEIRVVSYTEEGAPMLHDLEYDGEVLHSTTDTRRDGYGSGKIDSTTCKKIEVTEKTERTDYDLSGCERTNLDNSILVIWK